MFKRFFAELRKDRAEQKAWNKAMADAHEHLMSEWARKWPL